MTSNICPTSPKSGRVNPHMDKVRTKQHHAALRAVQKSQDQTQLIGLLQRNILQKTPPKETVFLQKSDPLSKRVNPQMGNNRPAQRFPQIAGRITSQHELPEIGLLQRTIVNKPPEQLTVLVQKAQQSTFVLPPLAVPAKEGSPDDQNSPETHFRNSRDVANAFSALIIKK